MATRCTWPWSCGWLLLLCGILVALSPTARAQVPLLTTPPAPAPADVSRPTQSPLPSLEKLAEQLRALENRNRTLADQLERSRGEHDRQMKDLLDKYQNLSQLLRDREGSGQTNGAAPAGTEERPAPGPGDTPVPDYTEDQFTTKTPAPGYPGSNVLSPYKFPLKATFGPGFQLYTEDDRYRLEIHYEGQFEGRLWEPGDQGAANSGIYLPRQRIFFNGNITPLVEYEFAINRGLNNLNLLNAYLNLHFDDRFELRFGRFFTPLLYEQYAVSNYWLLTPERSLFSSNLGLNRQFGAMGWGYLFDKRLDYAFGAFNGSRNSFENLSNSLDLVAYLNARPFQESESLWFARFLNVGTSVGFGQQDQPPAPAVFRIGAGSPDTNIPGPATEPFLTLNPGVVERGGRVVGSVHAAYYLGGLSLLGEWQYGHGNYATAANPVSAEVPYSGFYAAAGYFLTGEQVERRTRVKPLRPLIPLNKDEERGLGAWEAVARVSQLHLGEQIFASGFADPNLWSNSATTTELGMNWYWNDYMKVYMFWLHGDFGSPVQLSPGNFQKTADMFWLRCQLYF